MFKKSNGLRTTSLCHDTGTGIFCDILRRFRRCQHSTVFLSGFVSNSHQCFFCLHQELISSLQNFVLGLTQRLHNVEVERRDLRLEVTALKKEKDELRKAVEKRQLESQDVYRDIEGMREKVRWWKARND